VDCIHAQEFAAIMRPVVCRVGLWLCLSCGWVACSDDSPNQHAKAHYQETDHPLAVSLEHDRRQRWCYVHQRTV
jgi:uncharacterized UBP type Zn finger protein